MSFRRKPKQMNTAFNAFKNMIQSEFKLLIEPQTSTTSGSAGSISPASSPVLNPFVIGQGSNSISEHKKILESKYRPKEVKIEDNDIFLPQALPLLFASVKGPSAFGIDWEMNFLSNFDNHQTRLNEEFQEAQRKCNLKKNRYQNVLPNDSSRVVLEAKKYVNDRLSAGYDYINANFIPSYLFRLQQSTNSSPKTVFGNFFPNPNSISEENLFNLFLNPSFHEIFKYSASNSKTQSSSPKTSPNSIKKLSPSVFNDVATSKKEIIFPFQSCHKDYIATQAPLEETMLDFWEMVLEQDCYLLISLTTDPLHNQCCPGFGNYGNLSSNNTPISFEDKPWGQKFSVAPTTSGYWPKDTSSPIFIEIPEKNELRDVEFVKKYFPKSQQPKIGKFDQNFGIEIELLEEKHFEDEETMFRKLRITHYPSGLSKEVSSLQFLGWPDMQVPEDAKIFAKFMKRVDAISLIHDAISPSSANPHILVHCNAGVGRSGTFCAIHIIFHQYYQYLQQHGPVGAYSSKIKENKENNSGSAGNSPVYPKNNTLFPITNENGENENKDSRFLFNVVECAYKLKNQRCGMIQNSTQLKFVYEAVDALCGLIDMGNNSKE